jgi:quinol monooxygenase YgiN
MAAAPPYVSYSSFTEALIPAETWTAVYASLQALKGHVQEYPGCQSFDVFVQADTGGDVRIHVYTTWDTPEQLEVFLDRGYTTARLLADLGEAASGDDQVMEKVF